MKVARAKQRIAYTPSRWDIAAIVLLVGGLLSPAITLVVWKIFHLPGGMAFFTATGFVAYAVAVATLRLLILPKASGASSLIYVLGFPNGLLVWKVGPSALLFFLALTFGE